MFTDKRSKKVILVAHCILNQNSKIDRCAHYPGAASNLARILVDSGIGIIQLPCPELLYLGLDRQADSDRAASVEEEDTRVAHLMAAPEFNPHGFQMVEPVIRQVTEYLRNGFDVVGYLGINGSPTCGVETTWADMQEKPCPGEYTRMLQDAFQLEGIDLPMRGVKVYLPEEAEKTLRELIGDRLP